MAGPQRYNDRDDGHDSHEERRGLLGGAATGWHDDEDQYPAQQLYSEKQQAPLNTWSNSRILGVAVGVILLLVGGVAVKDKLAQLFVPHTPLRFDANEVLSNGTHEFKRTVLLVSIDGLRCVTTSPHKARSNHKNRADYLDRGLTPHLLDISKQGLRAKSMKPIFPVRQAAPSVLLVPNSCDEDPDFPVRRSPFSPKPLLTSPQESLGSHVRVLHQPKHPSLTPAIGLACMPSRTASLPMWVRWSKE